MQRYEQFFASFFPQNPAIGALAAAAVPVLIGRAIFGQTGAGAGLAVGAYIAYDAFQHQQAFLPVAPVPPPPLLPYGY